MDNNRSAKFYQLIQHPILWAVIFGILIFAILIAFVVSLILGQEPYGTEFKIDNLTQEIPDLPSEKQHAIQSTLYRRIEQERGENADIPRSGALVRAGSVRTNYDPNTDIHSGGFYIDIAALQKSYQITYKWSETQTNPALMQYDVVISCPADGDAIYPSDSCNYRIDNPNTNSYEAVVMDQGVQILHIESGDGVRVTPMYYSDSTKVYIDTAINSCGDQVKVAAAKKAAEDWLDAIDIPKDYFTIYTRDLCNGAAQ